MFVYELNGCGFESRCCHYVIVLIEFHQMTGWQDDRTLKGRYFFLSMWSCFLKAGSAISFLNPKWYLFSKKIYLVSLFSMLQDSMWKILISQPCYQSKFSDNFKFPFFIARSIASKILWRPHEPNFSKI